MAFRLLDQHPVFIDSSFAPCVGGTLTFSESGGTTPKAVFAEPGLTTNLGSVIDIDADGRAESEIWLASDVPYRVVLRDGNGVTIYTRDNVRDTVAGGVTPLDPADGTDGQVQYTDGAAAYWGDVRQLPDPTGHAGEIIYTDGELAYYGPLPAAEVFDADNLPGGITAAPSVIHIGNEVLLKGTGTCPTSATTSSTVAVSFGYTFASAPQVWVTASVGAVTGESAKCSMQALSASTTGFTASAFAGAEDGGGSLNISTAVTFSWLAWGTAP